MNANYNRPAASRLLPATLAAVAAVLTLASVSGLADHTYAVAASHATAIVVASR